MGLRSVLVEWRARRAGRKGMPHDVALARVVREVSGLPGSITPQGWEIVAEDPEGFVESFDEKLPPSLFVSERDRTRHGMPIPLVERAIEDHRKADVDLDELEKPGSESASG